MLQPLGAARLGSLGRSASATSRSCSLPQRLSTAAAFKWKRAEPTKNESGKEENIGLTGLKQLVGMGLGTMVGELKEINLDDPARTVVLELEANNFEDAEGNPLALKSMNNEGWTSDDEAEQPQFLNIALPLALGAGAVAGVIATLKALS